MLCFSSFYLSEAYPPGFFKRGCTIIPNSTLETFFLFFFFFFLRKKNSALKDCGVCFLSTAKCMRETAEVGWERQPCQLCRAEEHPSRISLSHSLWGEPASVHFYSSFFVCELSFSLEACRISKQLQSTGEQCLEISQCCALCA